MGSQCDPRVGSHVPGVAGVTWGHKSDPMAHQVLFHVSPYMYSGRGHMGSHEFTWAHTMSPPGLTTTQLM
jgi:hypothetical protein